MKTWATLLRLTVTLAFVAISAYAYATWQVPRLAFGGVLRVINTGIVIYLLILTVRHFMLMFFCLKEQIRRDSVADPENWPPISIIVPAK